MPSADTVTSTWPDSVVHTTATLPFAARSSPGVSATVSEVDPSAAVPTKHTSTMDTSVEPFTAIVRLFGGSLARLSAIPERPE